MTLAPGEFIRRFLLHVLPKGFHRIRHYGLLASATCKANIARARELIAAPVAVTDPPAEHDDADLATSAAADHRPPCPCCGGRMIIVETFERGGAPRARRRPKPRSEPRCHDARHRLIAPSACRGTPLPASHRCRPAASNRTPLCPRSGQNRPVDRRRGDKLPTAIVDPPPITPASASPTQAAAPSNPHRRQPVRPAPAGSFLGGFRTPALSARWIGHDGPASETLHPSGTAGPERHFPELRETGRTANLATAQPRVAGRRGKPPPWRGCTGHPSPSTSSTPRAASGSVSLPGRTSARTRRPCAVRSLQTFEPMSPVPPVIITASAAHRVNRSRRR